MKVYLIDANALIYRLYHALPRFEDAQGRPTQAIYGLANILLKLLKEEKPDYIFAIYDRPEPTIRHQLFKEYKATRPKAADDLKIQIQFSKKIFSAFKIPIIEKIGYEADDLIAVLKGKFINFADEIIILTGDLDVLQLVDTKTKIFIMQKGISQKNIYDIANVQKKYGILPEQICDYKALVGDASDNIVGLKGIGPKTASKLLQSYQNIEGIIKAAKDKKIEPKLAQKIIENEERLLFYRDLVTLRKDIEIKDIELLPYQGYSDQDLISVFQEFGFKSLIQRLQGENFSKTAPQFLIEEKINLQNINTPFFFFKDNDDIKIIDMNEKIKILNKKDLKNLLKISCDKFTYDLKFILKEILSEDSGFYFDKEIDIFKIYDIKIIFWLLNPNKSNYSLEKIISFFYQDNKNFLSSVLKVCQILKQKLYDENLADLYFKIELPLVGILSRSELRGIKINIDDLQNFKNKLQIEIQNISNEIYKLAGERFNLNSTLQLRKILFEKLKIKTKGLKKTSKGEISTSEEDLLKIVHHHPIIEKIIFYRKINKFLTTYSDSLLKNYDPLKKRIFTYFEQTGASTGRIISKNPNLQNIPLKGDLAKFLRKIFVSEDGFVFVSGDYSQLELRLLAHLSQDANLIAAFLQDLDIHSQTAKILFGDDSLENRHKGKIVNFSIIYGVSARSLANYLNITVSEANKLIEKFYYFYPGVKKLKEELINFAQTYGYVKTLFGRKRFLPEIFSQAYQEKKFAERVAFNMPIQGLGADLLKKAMIDIDEEIVKNNLQNSVFFVLSVHDEIIFEVKEEIKEKFKFIIKERMENVYQLSVPLKVKIREGKNLDDLR